MKRRPITWIVLLRVVYFSALLNSATHVPAQSGQVVQPQWELYKINADGTGLARFADTPGYSCGSPKWSPDGTMVAYDTRRIEEDLLDSQVAVIRSDGTGLRLLGEGAMPSWSPDGTQLVCHTYDPRVIVVMKSDGTGRETIIHHFGSPRWLPKGNCIASIDDSGGIALFDLATGTERGILSGPYSLRPGFAVSRDGLRFIFGDNDGGLHLAILDERTMRTSVRTIVDKYPCYHVSWSPDGTRIVFSWNNQDRWLSPQAVLLALMSFGSYRPLFDGPSSQLYLWDDDSNEPPRLITGQNHWRNNVNPDWSPDGKMIIFASQKRPVSL